MKLGITNGSVANIVHTLRNGKLVRAVIQANGRAITPDNSVTVTINKIDLPSVCRDLKLNKISQAVLVASIVLIDKYRIGKPTIKIKKIVGIIK
tara:strand:+ start:26 stop:307 length:282 start_codon:yes stop_codon:yes gene_type:complete